MTDTPAPASTAAPARAMTRRRVLIYATSVLAGLLLVAWCVHWWRNGRFQIETDDAYLRADIVTVAPRISGYLAEVRVQDNPDSGTGGTSIFTVSACQVGALMSSR